MDGIAVEGEACLLPGDALDVDQNAEQLGDGERRMSVVQLDGHLWSRDAREEKSKVQSIRGKLEQLHKYEKWQRRRQWQEQKRHLVGERVERGAHEVARAEFGRLEAPDDVLQRRRHQEVLLLQTQLLALKELRIGARAVVRASIHSSTLVTNYELI